MSFSTSGQPPPVWIVGAGKLDAEPWPPLSTAAERMAARLMSRSARMAHLATTRALAEAAWGELDEVGLFMGVGASGADLDQLETMLRASRDPAGAYSDAEFGGRGLRACNPLFAFQLMNNFTLAHAAILAGLRGPNAALFSRGVGTVQALDEARWAIAAGECRRALAGGADSALDEVTRCELHREGHLGRGIVPSEGAAVLALASDGAVDAATPVRGRLTGVWVVTDWRRRRPAAMVDGCTGMRDLSSGIDLVVMAAACRADEARLEEVAEHMAPSRPRHPVGSACGALAAAPALAWVAALGALSGRRGALVLTAGPESELGVVTLTGAARS